VFGCFGESNSQFSSRLGEQRACIVTHVVARQRVKSCAERASALAAIAVAYASQRALRLLLTSLARTSSLTCPPWGVCVVLPCSSWNDRAHDLFCQTLPANSARSSLSASSTSHSLSSCSSQSFGRVGVPVVACRSLSRLSLHCLWFVQLP
jgi:hypothetical protein